MTHLGWGVNLYIVPTQRILNQFCSSVNCHVYLIPKEKIKFGKKYSNQILLALKESYVKVEIFLKKIARKGAILGNKVLSYIYAES